MSENTTERGSEELREGPVAGAQADEHSTEATAAESAQTDGGADFNCQDEQEEPGGQFMPKPTFSTFVLSLASSALVHLGEVPEPSSGTVKENLVLAKHSIDILCMLQDKIQNGLDEDETRLLNGLLYELRMKYVVKK